MKSPTTRGSRRGAGSARDALNAGPLRMSEDDFQTRVIQTARLNGWKVTHFRPVKLPSGRWGTPLQGDAGLPDLVLARNGVVLLAELKSDTGRPTTEQAEWLAAAGPHGRLWSPADWPEVVAELSRSATRNDSMAECCNPRPRG